MREALTERFDQDEQNDVARLMLDIESAEFALGMSYRALEIYFENMNGHYDDEPYTIQ
jgi:hypothetical protein